MHASVGGWRRIKVPAGEFDAIEVRRQRVRGNAEFFNSQEEIVEVEWYAPSVGHAVASRRHVEPRRHFAQRRRPRQAAARARRLADRRARAPFRSVAFRRS